MDWRVSPLFLVIQALGFASVRLQPVIFMSTIASREIASSEETRSAVPSARTVAKRAPAEPVKLVVERPVTAKLAMSAFNVRMQQVQHVSQCVAAQKTARCELVRKDSHAMEQQRQVALHFASSLSF